MAISGPDTNDTNGNAFNYANQPAQQAQQQAPVTETQTAQQAPGLAQPFNYRPGLAPTQLRLNSASQKVQDTLVAINKMIEPALNQLNFELRILPVERELFSLRYSALVMVGTTNIGGKQTTVTQTLMLTSTGAEPEMRTVQIMDRKISRLPVAAEAYDDRYITAVREVVAREIKSDFTIELGAITLPVDFDEKSEMVVGTLLTDTLTALDVTLKQRHPEFVDLTLEGVNQQGRTETKVIFNRQTVLDAAGAPMRADIYMATSSIPQANRAPGVEESLNGPENNSQTINRTYAFIEPMWVGYNQQQTGGWGNQNQNQKYESPFIAQAVVTHMESPQAETIPGFLLGLLPLVRLSENNTWYTSYYTQLREAQKGQHQGVRSELGALNIEAGQVIENGVQQIHPSQGDTVDLAANDVGPEMFKSFMDRMFRPGLAVAVDCQISGPDSWRTDLLLEAGRGNVSAERKFIAAANVLTGGVFEQLWAEAQRVGPVSVVSAANVLVHLGNYTMDGVQRDIRDVGHVEVATYFNRQNVRQIETWCDTFVQKPGQTSEEALAYRLEVLQAILTGLNLRITGMAERVSLSSVFLRCLDAAAAQCGLSLNINVPTPLAGLQTERGVANYLNSATLGQYVSSSFSRGSSGYGMGAMYGQGRGFVRQRW